MKSNMKGIAAAIVILIVVISMIYYYVLLPWTNIDTAVIKKELPAATGQPGFHHGSEFIIGLYQIPEVTANDR